MQPPFNIKGTTSTPSPDALNPFRSVKTRSHRPQHHNPKSYSSIVGKKHNFTKLSRNTEIFQTLFMLLAGFKLPTNIPPLGTLLGRGATQRRQQVPLPTLRKAPEREGAEQR